MKSLEQKITASWDFFIIDNENRLDKEKFCEDISLHTHLTTQDEDFLLEERSNFEDYFENSSSPPMKQAVAKDCPQNKEELLQFLKEFKVQKEVFGRILFKQELQKIDSEILDSPHQK